MPDAHISSSDAQSPRPLSRNPAHRWLHTLELGLLFLVLAILADMVGTAHDEATAVIGQRNPSSTHRATPRAALAHGQVISIATRPATPR